MYNINMTILVLAFLLCTLVFSIFAYQKILALDKTARASWASLDIALRARQESAVAIAALIASKYPAQQDFYDRAAVIKTDCHTELLLEDRIKREEFLTLLCSDMLNFAKDKSDILENPVFEEHKLMLERAEEKINFKAVPYNDAVRDYNTLIKSVLTIVVAKMFDFKEKAYFHFKK